MVNVYWSEQISSLKDHLFHCFTTLFNSLRIGMKHTDKHTSIRSLNQKHTHTLKGMAKTKAALALANTQRCPLQAKSQLFAKSQ